MEQKLADALLEKIKEHQTIFGLSLTEVVLVLDLLHTHFANEAVKLSIKGDTDDENK